MRPWIYVGVAALAALGLAAALVPRGATPAAPAGGEARTAAAGETAGSPGIVAPASLTPQQAMGERAFAATCASCHGALAAGTDKGPTMISPDYLPAHHPDSTFVQAVRAGVPAHDAAMGDMPAIRGLTGADVANIVAYVRALQGANGVGG